jgi:hypothetical protein
MTSKRKLRSGFRAQRIPRSMSARRGIDGVLDAGMRIQATAREMPDERRRSTDYADFTDSERRAKRNFYFSFLSVKSA